MTITIDIREDKLDEFWQVVQKHKFQATDLDDLEIPEWHKEEMERRDREDTGPGRPWSEIRKKYVERGLLD